MSQSAFQVSGVGGSDEEEIVRSPSPELVRELALVLHALDIPYRSVQGPGYLSLFVPQAFAGRALEELGRYSRENRHWPPARARLAAQVRGGGTAVLVYAALLALVHRLAAVRAFGFDWYEAGHADGARIARGELWRPMTALTLHADFLHLASNLVLGSAIGFLLSKVYGSGLAWLVVLAAGWLGNLANAAARGFDHSSLGASTAVFAALGALAATQSVHKLRLGHGLFARVAPLVAAAFLLGWHGMGSAHLEPGRGVVQDPADRTDIGAHLFGFAAGVLLGGLVAWLETQRGSSPRARRAAAAAALALPVVGWALALALS